MKKREVIKDSIDFDGRILLVGIAFAQHNQPRIPRQLLANYAWKARKIYVKYCNSLDEKIFNLYQEDLVKRLNKGFPKEMEIIPNKNQVAKPRTLTIEDLKAYDAYKIFTAKRCKKDFVITEDGKLIVEEADESELHPNDDKLKDIDEYWLY